MPLHHSKDVTMTDTWSNTAMHSKFSLEERLVLKEAVKMQVSRF